MIYNTIFNLTEHNNFKTLAIGTALYVVIHSFIYSKYTEGSEIVQNYRKYLYFIFLLDLILLITRIKMLTTEPIKKKNGNGKGKGKKVGNPLRRTEGYPMQFSYPPIPIPAPPVPPPTEPPACPLPPRPFQAVITPQPDDDFNFPIYTGTHEQSQKDDQSIPLYDPTDV
jgi:hypothetical protein